MNDETIISAYETSVAYYKNETTRILEDIYSRIENKSLVADRCMVYTILRNNTPDPVIMEIINKLQKESKFLISHGPGIMYDHETNKQLDCIIITIMW